MDIIFDELISSFIDHKIGLKDAFFPEKLAKDLTNYLKSLYEENLLRSARIGANHLETLDKTIRKDYIYWLDKGHDNTIEDDFFLLIDEFVQYLNRYCYAGIVDYEFHFAYYEPGSFYKRHVDQFQNNNQRKYTFICYLNENWQKGDGGELNAYLNNETIQIEPQYNRAVFFKSDEIEHEVLVAKKDRLSITGWFKVTNL